MANEERYGDLLSQRQPNNYRVGDVVIVFGKPRLVTLSEGGLIVVGKGRGNVHNVTPNLIERLVVRNYKLKAGYSFCGVTCD